MAKQFYTEGTGNQQVLHTAQDDKIPVYENKDAVEADFANLAENQLVATKDMGVDPSVVPVGFIVPQYRKVARKGWLYLDGSEFDENEYPALYLYLGTNVLPDYREFGLVGAEENTTDVYNASTNPTGTIHDHDVYTEGQAKDDQLQFSDDYEVHSSGLGYSHVAGQQSWNFLNLGSPNLRKGTVTRGKRKAVYYYIKAVDGEQIANESQFLTTVKNYLKTAESYSTEETLTGGTWIDGKPIYSIVIPTGALPNNTSKTVDSPILNLDFIIKMDCLVKNHEASQQSLSKSNMDLYFIGYSTPQRFGINVTFDASTYSGYLIVEYTKTTD